MNFLYSVDICKIILAHKRRAVKERTKKLADNQKRAPNTVRVLFAATRRWPAQEDSNPAPFVWQREAFSPVFSTSFCHTYKMPTSSAF